MIYPRCKPIAHRDRAVSPGEGSRSRSPMQAGPTSPNPKTNTIAPSEQLKSPSKENRDKDNIFRQSRVDQSVHLMKIIYEKAGEPVRPGGHSQFDALGTLKSDIAFKVLTKKRWADFFEDLKDSGGDTSEHGAYTDTIGAGAGAGAGGNGSSNKLGNDHSHFASTSVTERDRSATELEQEKEDSAETFRVMKKRVQNLWKELKMPDSDTDFYSFNLLRSFSGSIEQFSDIARYIVVLTNYRGSTMAVLDGIRNREFAIVNLLDFLSQIKRRSSIEEFKENLLSCLQNVQITTINVIHQIQNWRANFWRALPFHYRGENYLIKMQSDLDALKTESLGSILRDCNIRPADILCIVFSLENLKLNGMDEEIDESASRLISAIPVKALIDAAGTVIGDHELQQELKRERKQLIRDGVFIPMLRYEHSLEQSRGSRISGGIIPHSASAPMYPSSYADDNSSRVDFGQSQVSTEGSSRIDV